MLSTDFVDPIPLLATRGAIPGSRPGLSIFQAVAMALRRRDLHPGLCSHPDYGASMLLVSARGHARADACQRRVRMSKFPGTSNTARPGSWIPALALRARPG